MSIWQWLRDTVGSLSNRSTGAWVPIVTRLPSDSSRLPLSGPSTTARRNRLTSIRGLSVVTVVSGTAATVALRFTQCETAAHREMFHRYRRVSRDETRSRRPTLLCSQRDELAVVGRGGLAGHVSARPAARRR